MQYTRPNRPITYLRPTPTAFQQLLEQQDTGLPIELLKGLLGWLVFFVVILGTMYLGLTWVIE